MLGHYDSTNGYADFKNSATLLTIARWLRLLCGDSLHDTTNLPWLTPYKSTNVLMTSSGHHTSTSSNYEAASSANNAAAAASSANNAAAAASSANKLLLPPRRPPPLLPPRRPPLLPPRRPLQLPKQMHVPLKSRPCYPANQLLPSQPAYLPSHPANLLKLTLSLLPRNRGTALQQCS